MTFDPAFVKVFVFLLLSSFGVISYFLRRLIVDRAKAVDDVTETIDKNVEVNMEKFTNINKNIGAVKSVAYKNKEDIAVMKNDNRHIKDLLEEIKTDVKEIKNK